MKNYWNEFYAKRKVPIKPSRFAIFCKKYLKNFNGLIFDLGCGNGRDTFYFNRKNLRCIGIDRSKTIILKNKKKADFFKQANFTKFNFSKVDAKLALYFRFSIHSINEIEEKNLFYNINNSINIEYLLIEVRTVYDDLFGKGKKLSSNEFVANHYRRFILPNRLKIIILDKFKINVFKLSKNFAKYKNENPKILRIVATRKK